ncbi:MAG: hypothetical protein AAB588_04240 [Patescibacteria group bacterium]
MAENENNNPEQRPREGFSEFVIVPPSAEGIVKKQSARLNRMGASAELDNYLWDSPQLHEYLEQYKTGLLKEFKSLLTQARGTPIEKHASELVKNFESDFDSALLRLLKFTDVKSNPDVLARILKNKDVPKFQVKPLGKFLGGTTEKPDEGIIVITISSNAEMNQTYEGMLSVVVHEFAHAYIESLEYGAHGRNRALNEGITEAIARDATLGPANAYLGETNLAYQLILINKDAVMDWYTGGSDAEFGTALFETFQRKLPTAAAQELARAVVEFGQDALKRSVEHTVKMAGDIGKTLSPNDDDPDGYKRGKKIHNYIRDLKYGEAHALFDSESKLGFPSNMGQWSEFMGGDSTFYRDEENNLQTLIACVHACL